MTSALHTFAANHRLHSRRVALAEPEIVGRNGAVYGPTPAGHLILTIFSGPSTARWRSARRKCLAAGMELWQDRDAEGSFAFNPSEPTQARLAVRLTGARQKRRVSAETATRLRTYSDSRKTPSQEGKSSVADPRSAAGRVEERVNGVGAV